MNEQKFRAEVMHEYILRGKYAIVKPATSREAGGLPWWRSG